MAGELSWLSAVAWLCAGSLALWLVDKYVYPVCPTCAVPHDHDHCATDLHGFAAPLLVAASVHAALDGWSVLAADGMTHLSHAFVLAIAVHKIPEGIALGVIVRAAVGSRWKAFGWCALAEAATLAGAGLETFLAPYVGSGTLHILLAAAGGSFLYLGGHAVHAEWQKRAGALSWAPGLAGLASPAVLKMMGVFR
jgi:zinc and cadmium transporter